MKRNDLVYYMFDTRAFGPSPLYGIVEKAGEKTATIRWASGMRNRVAQDRDDIHPITDPEMMEDARRKMSRK